MTCITTLHCKHWLTYKSALCILERQLRGTGPADFPQDRLWHVYLRQNGREKCDEKGEPSCHAFRFSWAAASPTIIFPERAYSNVKGCNENKCRRVKRYILLRVHDARHFSVQEHVKFPGYPKGEGETGKSASSLIPLRLKISTEHV